MGFLKKPRFGQPCNGCGFCCMLEVCAIGVAAHGLEVKAPCPSLVKKDNSYFCDLVLAEKAFCEKTGKPPLIAEALGIGVSCDAGDYSVETDTWKRDMRKGKFSSIREKKEIK